MGPPRSRPAWPSGEGEPEGPQQRPAASCPPVRLAVAELPSAARPSQRRTSVVPRATTARTACPFGDQGPEVTPGCSQDTSSAWTHRLLSFPSPPPSRALPVFLAASPSPNLCSCESLHPLEAPLVLGHGRGPQARGSQTTPAVHPELTCLQVSSRLPSPRPATAPPLLRGCHCS